MNDIQLIPLREDDIELVRMWRNSPEVSQYMYTDEFISEEHQKLWFNKIKNENNSRYWIIEFENKKIGVASLTDIDTRNSKCFWGFYLGTTDNRGKGIGAKIEYKILEYVFEDLKLNKLCGEVLSFNENVIRMHEKFGFRREGYLRNHIRKQEKFHDVVVIALLSYEWYQIKEMLHKKIYG